MATSLETRIFKGDRWTRALRSLIPAGHRGQGDPVHAPREEFLRRSHKGGINSYLASLAPGAFSMRDRGRKGGRPRLPTGPELLERLHQQRSNAAPVPLQPLPAGAGAPGYRRGRKRIAMSPIPGPLPYPLPEDNPDCHCSLALHQMFCWCGHMTECHVPYTCMEAACSHLERYDADPEDIADARIEAAMRGYPHLAKGV